MEERGLCHLNPDRFFIGINLVEKLDVKRFDIEQDDYQQTDDKKPDYGKIDQQGLLVSLHVNDSEQKYLTHCRQQKTSSQLIISLRYF